MKKPVAFVIGAVGAAAVSTAVFGAGVAHADALVGKTYSDATSKISGWNGKAIISTVVGDQLGTDQCIVSGWHKGAFLDGSGAARKNEYYLDLNCNQALAGPGDPGNSLATPQGQKAKKDIVAAENINKSPAWCNKSDKNMTWCVGVCQRTGLCDVTGS